MPRQLAITKRISLEGLSEGWTSDCYALVTPASYAEYIDFADLTDAGKSNTDLLKFQLSFVKKHLVSGKVNILDDKGQLELDDLQPEDVDASKDLADKLFTEIVGVNLDPKASSTATETSPISAATK
ncbi:hypothetical protein QN355_11770 [Cryobacterium sp. 10S3]|uniref:hypothetical protein n=1 Tax=Cryobacterium sp. 10S3 TaxID=3048582 RepID=UPI002AC8E8BA|nr:hypothetical protein [Cryobacterium sp. 10S3]MEB0287232.1 hypothetical protein [Cryobacterium sp. 10S3]WPX14187.1 hypothetical protein RHM57_02090 [Cryobacterium sp. 10S3]